MLTVTTPATSARLATLAAVKAELAITDDAQDSHLGDLLDQASAAIAVYCSRVFGLEAVQETFRWAGPAETLVLARVPVVSIASVTEDGTALAAEDYEVDEGAGLLYRLRGDYRSRWCARKVVVSYSAGWLLPEDEGANLPADVTRACLLTVSAWWHARGRDPMLRSESDQSIGAVSYIATADMGGLPPQAQALLAPYRQWTVA